MIVSIIKKLIEPETDPKKREALSVQLNRAKVLKANNIKGERY